MNEVIISNSTTSLPTQTPPNMERAIRLFTSQLFAVGLGHELPAKGAPTPEQRDGMERRVARIKQWLAPSMNEFAIKAEVASVLGTMAGRGGSEIDADTTLRIYAEDLMDLPFFAVAAACRDFRQGRAGDRKWAPTQAEIREVAQRHMVPIAKEGRMIQAILDAKVVDVKETPERRKAVVGLVADLVKSMRDRARQEEQARKTAETKQREAEAEANSNLLAKCITEGVPDPRPMPKLDPTILRQFGIREDREAAE